MSFSLPPIVRAAERLLLEIELAVSAWPRRHKYLHGARLRDKTMRVAELTQRAWRDRERQQHWLEELVWAIDDLKLSLQLGKQIHAFVSFRQFEMLARLTSDLGRQCGGWKKQVDRRSQNAAGQNGPEQCAQILSSRAASIEANP